MQDEVVIDITDRVRKIVGEQVKYATVSRETMKDDLVEETESGFVLNPDWDGHVYISFENGAEIEVCGSDYVSVIIRKVNKQIEKNREADFTEHITDYADNIKDRIGENV